MADATTGADSRPGEGKDVKDRSAEKRHSTDSSEGSSPLKKMNFSITPKAKPLLNQKISFDLGTPSQNKPAAPTAANKTKASLAPIKMSLNPTVKKEKKEAPPVTNKSSVAAKIFNESDDSGDEEMPPEAKMRMKNIGRDTPTASGPNSYGKGKQGFTDRHKVLEKQLKEEMEKVSGDNEWSHK